MHSDKIVVYSPIQDFFYNTDEGVLIIQLGLGAVIIGLLTMFLYVWLASKFRITNRGKYPTFSDSMAAMAAREKILCRISCAIGVILFGFYIYWIV